MPATMNAHTLIARSIDGQLIEIGTLGHLETACRLRAALEHELGEEYTAFSIVEQDGEPEYVTGRSVRRDELAERRLAG